MKEIFFIFFFSMLLTHLSAQKETFDLITYTSPKDAKGTSWKKDVMETTTSFTYINNKNKSWCRINIIKSTISKGSIDQDFESEWQNIVIKSYKPTDTPQLNDVQETDGWKIRTGAAKFVYNKSDALAMLTTVSGYSRCASIVATTNNQEYLKDIQALLSSVEFNKPVTTAQIPVITNNSDNNSIFGTWSVSASEQSAYRVNNGIMNYIIRQYTFNANGTYSFVSKTFDPFVTNILLGRENGTFQITGSNLTVTPEKSVLEAWSKKENRDEWGKLLSSQNIPLEKVTYQFTKQDFSGMQEWSLVLQTGKATRRDGPTTSSTEFKDAWFYSSVSASSKLILLPGGVKSND